MAASASVKPKTGKKKPVVGSPSAPSIAQYCECVKGEKLVNEVTNALVRKSEAAMCIWSHALGGELQREDIFKTQCIGFLVSMLERGQVEEKHAACGALYALAQSDKHLPEVVSPRVRCLPAPAAVSEDSPEAAPEQTGDSSQGTAGLCLQVIQGAAALLGGEHDRSRLPAAQFLAFLAKRLEYSARVAEAALPALLAACSSGAVPGWSGSRFTALQCVTALRCLVENVQGLGSWWVKVLQAEGHSWAGLRYTRRATLHEPVLSAVSASSSEQHIPGIIAPMLWKRSGHFAVRYLWGSSAGMEPLLTL
ncbi:hypothetical protein QJQ45_019066 [Haematococcus lacustris]|nr:hypothetical protein QJQ45_019066 [Haematococcus lacustris]